MSYKIQQQRTPKKTILRPYIIGFLENSNKNLVRVIDKFLNNTYQKKALLSFMYKHQKSFFFKILKIVNYEFFSFVNYFIRGFVLKLRELMTKKLLMHFTVNCINIRG